MVFERNDMLTSNYGGVETLVKVLSNPTKTGLATVKVLRSGLLQVRQGAVVKDFDVYHGVIKFVKKGN